MFRNIVLPEEGSINVLEQNATREIPREGYFNRMEVGAGNKTMKMDERGLWMGSEDFEDAPFKVYMTGAVEITAGTSLDDVSFSFFDANGNRSIYFGFDDV